MKLALFKTAFISIILSIAALIAPLSAYDISDFLRTDKLVGKEEATWNNMNFSEESPANRSNGRIVSFDVSDSGKILLGLERNRLLILNPDGTPDRALRFHLYGSYYVEWFGENVALYSVRGDFVTVFSEDLQLIDLYSAKDRGYGEIEYMLSEKTKLDLSESTYRLEKDGGLAGFFAGYSYDRLVQTLPDGTEKILYEVPYVGKLYPKLVAAVIVIGFGIVLPLLIISGVIVPLIVRRKKKK